MKNYLLAGATLMIIGLTSCAKDFKCVCKKGSEVIVQSEIKDAVRADADAACSASKVGANVECKLE